MRNKERGIMLIATGALLLLAALSLCFWNSYEDKRAGEQAQTTVAELKEIIAEYEPAADSDYTADSEGLPTEDEPSNIIVESDDSEDEEEPEEEAVELDGRWYIGIITIPSLDIELPITREWSYDNLWVGACRYDGHVETNDLIIAGHSYTSYFKGLDKLSSGDTIIYTSLSGRVYTFEVVYTQLIGGTDVESMKSGSEDSWDITLFTCTWSGRSRVTVRGVRVDNE